MSKIGLPNLISHRGKLQLAHVLEHAVFLGTDKYPSPDSFKAALTELRMSYNADSNAYTDCSQTVYTLNSPAQLDSHAEGGKKVLPTLLGIIAQLAFHAKLDEKPLVNEKKSVLSEAAMRNTVDYRVEISSRSLLHPEPLNSLRKRAPIGLPSVIKGATPAQLRAYYERWYRPGHMILVLSGCFDSEEALACITDAFGSELGPSASLPPLPPYAQDSRAYNQWAVPPVLDIRPNASTWIPHSFHAPVQRPLLIVQHPQLSYSGFLISIKKPLPVTQVRTKHQFLEYVTDSILDWVFEGRVDSLWSGALSACVAGQQPAHGGEDSSDKPKPKPIFTDISWGLTHSIEDECSFMELSVGSDMRFESEADATFDGGPADESSLQHQQAWASAAWEAHAGRGHVWQRAIAVAVREAIRFGVHGPCPQEWAMACAMYLKRMRDEATTEASTETETLVDDIERGLATGSSMPSASQESEWLTHLHATGQLSWEYARQRAAESFGIYDKISANAQARLQAVASSGQLSSVDDASACAGLFSDIHESLTLFLFGAGPTDTVTPALAGTGADIGLHESSQVDSSEVATPGLIDRLGSMGRSAKLRALLAGQTVEDRTGEGDEDEGDEGEEEDDHDTDAAQGAADGKQVGDQESKRARLSDNALSSPQKGTKAVSPAVFASSPGAKVQREAAAKGAKASKKSASLYDHPMRAVEVLAALAHARSGAYTPPTDIVVPEHLVTPQVLQQRTETALAAHVAAGVAYGFAPLGAWPEHVRAHLVREGRHADDARQLSKSTVASSSSRVRIEPLNKSSPAQGAPGARVVDSIGGHEITTLRLSNGLSVSYTSTRLEPATFRMTLLARGGQHTETERGWVPGRPAGAETSSAESLLQHYFGPIAYGPAVPFPPGLGPTIDARGWLPPYAQAIAMDVRKQSGAESISEEALGRVFNLWGLSMDGVVTMETVQLGVGMVACRGEAGKDGSSAVSKAFEVLHAFLLAPRWDENAFVRCREKISSDTEWLVRNMEALSSEAADRSMTDHDLRSSAMSAEARLALTPQQCQQALNSVLVPGNCQLLIGGDFDPSEIETLALRWLGPWLPPRAIDLPLVAIPALPPSGGLPPPGTVVPMVASQTSSVPGLAVLSSAVVANQAGYMSWISPFLSPTGKHIYEHSTQATSSSAVLVMQMPSAGTSAESASSSPAARGASEGGLSSSTLTISSTHATRCLPTSVAPAQWLAFPPSLPSGALVLHGFPVVLRGRAVRALESDPTPRCSLTIIAPYFRKFHSLQELQTDAHFDTALFLGSLARGDSSSAPCSPWPGLRSHPNYLLRAQAVLGKILDNRLYLALRERSGICYAVSAGHQTSETGSGGAIEVTCTPSPVPSLPPRALAHAIHVLTAFLTGAEPVTEKEVEQSVKPLVEAMKTSSGRNEWWIRTAQGLYGIGGTCKGTAALYDNVAYYAQFTAQELNYARGFITKLTPQPLPLHISVGMSGRLSFKVDGDGDGDGGGGGGARAGKRKGTAPGRRGASGAWLKMEKPVVYSPSEDERLLVPIQDTEDLRQEWAAFMDRAVREVAALPVQTDA